MPRILVVHLKRFEYDKDGRFMKLQHRVSFDTELQIRGDGVFPMRVGHNLMSVVTHIGSSPMAGHYITIRRADGDWYLLDDDSVDP